MKVFGVKAFFYIGHLGYVLSGKVSIVFIFLLMLEEFDVVCVWIRRVA